MRTEAEMMGLILGVAERDERVRAVVMNGSRVNPAVKRDPFQDYDIVYFVTDLDSFRRTPGWIDVFGERMILQTPDEMGDPEPDPGPGYAYLMQFLDGNRIDLTLFPVDRIEESGRDSLSVELLDKDGIIAPFPPPSERDYLPKPPTAKQFEDCCNEFWWVSPYVAKGLWRRQLPYAKFHQDQVLRPQLMKLLEWHVGITSNFTSGVGSYGKHLEARLAPHIWRRLLLTYADADYDRIWEAQSAMADLFRDLATQIADRFGFRYPAEDDARVTAWLNYVPSLPSDAKTF